MSRLFHLVILSSCHFFGGIVKIEKVMVGQPNRGGIVAAIGPELGQLIVVGLWASTFIVTKAAFAEVSPLSFVFVRFGVMTALAFAVLPARRRTWRVRRSDLPRFFMAGMA